MYRVVGVMCREVEAWWLPAGGIRASQGTFYTPPLKKVRGIMLYPKKKNCVRVSVRLSVRPSVCLSVRQRFISGLYLEHLLTDFHQTLYRT